jgi:hypothetical protein
VSYYRRRLPHWHPESVALFITWRLQGSLPRHAGFLVQPTPTEGRRFVAIDGPLDRVPTDPTWLNDPQIAEVVKGSLHVG